MIVGVYEGVILALLPDSFLGIMLGSLILTVLTGVVDIYFTPYFALSECGFYLRATAPEEPPRQYPAPRPPDAPKPRQLPLLGGSLADLLPKSFGELETEDIILLLILYLMYRESGDSELLIIMGAMFLL